MKILISGKMISQITICLVLEIIQQIHKIIYFSNIVIDEIIKRPFLTTPKMLQFKRPRKTLLRNNLVEK